MAEKSLFERLAIRSRSRKGEPRYIGVERWVVRRAEITLPTDPSLPLGVYGVQFVPPFNSFVDDAVKVLKKGAPELCLVASGWERGEVHLEEFWDLERRGKDLICEGLYALGEIEDEEEFKRGVLSFAERFGNLEEPHLLGRLEGEKLLFGPPLFGVPLRVWRERTAEFYRCFKLLCALEETSDLLKLITWRPDGVYFSFEGVEEPIALGSEAYRFPRGSLKEPARYFLTTKVNQHLAGKSAYRLGVDGSPTISFAGPLGLAWFGIARILSGQHKIRACRYCGEPMFLSPGEKLYAHSWCRNRSNVARLRERERVFQKLLQEGKSAEEIAEAVAPLMKHGNPLEWVRKKMESGVGGNTGKEIGFY